jgi:putative oxidoreductase
LLREPGAEGAPGALARSLPSLPTIGVWYQLFAQIGWGQWFRYFTGGLQMGGALLLLLPWTFSLGALILACTMLGAIVVDVLVVRSPLVFVPFILLVGILFLWVSADRSPKDWIDRLMTR